MKRKEEIVAAASFRSAVGERGAAAIEYSLLLSVIAFTMISALSSAGGFASQSFENFRQRMLLAGGGSVSSASADGVGFGSDGDEAPADPDGEGDDPAPPGCVPQGFVPCH